MALGLVLARVWITAIILHLTGCPSEALWTGTHKTIQQGMAAATISARTAKAIVPLKLAVATNKTWLANALVASGCVLTGTSVLTLSMAAVQIDVTVVAHPSMKARTVISTNHIFARVSIEARLPHTLINIDLAAPSCPLWRTEAFKAVLHVDAGPSMSTGRGGTFICVFSTGWSRPASRTVTLKP